MTHLSQTEEPELKRRQQRLETCTISRNLPARGLIRQFLHAGSIAAAGAFMLESAGLTLTGQPWLSGLIAGVAAGLLWTTYRSREWLHEADTALAEIHWRLRRFRPQGLPDPRTINATFPSTNTGTKTFAIPGPPGTTPTTQFAPGKTRRRFARSAANLIA